MLLCLISYDHAENLVQLSLLSGLCSLHVSFVPQNGNVSFRLTLDLFEDLEHLSASTQRVHAAVLKLLVV